MDQLFWLIEGRLAGRAGPDKAPWNLGALRAAGVGAILSVNDGLGCRPGDFVPHGIAYACVPLSPNAPPEPGDDLHCATALPIADAFVAGSLAAGRVTLVHCTSGKDRTGLYLAYHLVKHHRASARDAFDRVRAVRPIAFSAPGWDEFAIEVLERAR